MYYSDAKTAVYELQGPSSYQLLPAGTRYILGVSMQQSGVASITLVKCGSMVIARNYSKDFPYTELSYKCTEAINISKTGNDDSTIIVNYVDRDISLSVEATPSAVVQLSNDTNIALGNSIYIVWFMLGVLILLSAIKIGTYIYKK